MKGVRCFPFRPQIILFAILVFTGTLKLQAQVISVPDGYAGFAGTTGGGEAIPITVSTVAAFKTAVSGNSAAVIYVDGYLSVGDVSIGSNKTIVGMTESSGIGGGKISVNGSNYIFQNLIIGPGSSDVLEVSGGTKVFITNCSIHDAGDELCSVVREADYVTFSWCKFYFDNPHDHAFVQLIGNSDSRTSDRGKLHVTLHHNWYAHGIRGRMPRVRYGHVHIYNNYYNSVGNGYCIGTGYECHIRLENTVFEDINNPWSEQSAGALESGGEIGWDNINFIGCSQPGYISNSFPTFTPPYEFVADPVEIVKTNVIEGAGNVFRNKPQVSIVTPEDKDVFAENADVNIQAEAIVVNGTHACVQFFSDTLLGRDTIAPYMCTWENVKPGMYEIYATATDSLGLTGISEKAVIFVGKGITITKPLNEIKFSIYADVEIEAIAWNKENSILKIEFFQDSILIGTDVDPPYSIIWNSISPDTVNVSARVVYSDSSIVESEKVVVILTGGPEGFEYCSPENGLCTINTIVNVAFGADGNFTYKYNVTSDIACNKITFEDPIPGIAKACYVQEVDMPYIKIISPYTGSKFSSPRDITIKVEALDDVSVDSVQFYLDNEYLGVSVDKPFTFVWSATIGGEYSITAKVYDNEGNSSLSEATVIIVGNAVGVLNLYHEDISIYPNPATKELSITLNKQNPQNTRVSLLDSFGKTVLKHIFSGNEYTLNLTNIKPGVYIVSISNDKDRLFEKVFIY